MAGPGVDVCNTIGGDLASTLVGDAWGVFQDYAYSAFQQAFYQINALSGFNADYINWNVSFEVDPTLSGFTRPQRPTLPTIEVANLADTIPDAPTINVAPIVLDAVPPEPGDLLNPPNLNLTVNAPEALSAVRPVSPGEIVIPDAPAEPVIAFPAAPELISPVLPLAPTITIEEFADSAPVFSATPPAGSIDFVETPYVSTFLDALKVHLNRLLAGQALPPEVEAALWGRAIDRDDIASLQALQEVDEDFADRGFGPEPNGIRARRRLQVVQDNRNKRAGLTRDIYIQNQQVALENIRFAVTSGIQLEGTLLQAHLQVEQRKFDMAVKIKDVAIAIFQAEVTQFNAVVEAFNARIGAYQAFLEGQRAKVDVYKAQVEAAKVEGEINAQEVAVYEARTRAEGVRADVYRSQIEGFRARIEAERTRIEAHKSEVDAYRAFVEAYKVEWDAERTRIEAEAKRGDLYNSLVNAYATRVDVWKTKGDVRIQEQRSGLLAAQAQLQRHDAQVRVVLGKLEAMRTVVQAQSAQSDAIARMYTADATVETAAVEADTRSFNAIVAKEQARVDLVLKDAQLQIAQLNNRSSLLLRALESAGQASSQLAASSMSAVNFSAGVSSGRSTSQGCNTSFSYSGEILDAV